MTIAQSTSAVLERPPVKLRLEPSQVVAHDARRAGSTSWSTTGRRRAGRGLAARARPRQRARFAFDHDGFTLGPAAPYAWACSCRRVPRRAARSVTRPFTVVALAGGPGVEMTAPSSSARARPRSSPRGPSGARAPPGVLAQGHVHGRGRQPARRGAPARRELSGADEFGRVVFAQRSPGPARPIGRTTAEVNHPKPDGGRASHDACG